MSTTPNPALRMRHLLLLSLLFLGCGASAPAISPDDDAVGETVDAPAEVVAVPALADTLKGDPTLRIEPHSPGEPLPAGAAPARLIELPADHPAADPAVLYQRLLDLGVSRVQLELLLPADAPEAPRFQGDGDPGFVRFRLRPSPRKTPPPPPPVAEPEQ